MSRQPGKLAKALAEQADGEVRSDAGSRGAYAAGASDYRQVPPGAEAGGGSQGGGGAGS